MKQIGENISANNNNNKQKINNFDRKAKSRKVIENEKIKLYLNQLTDLIPNKPRGRKLSSLEVIQGTIDYISRLESALETNRAVFNELNESLQKTRLEPSNNYTKNPTLGSFAAIRQMNNNFPPLSPSKTFSLLSSVERQPLGTLTYTVSNQIKSNDTAAESVSDNQSLTMDNDNKSLIIDNKETVIVNEG